MTRTFTYRPEPSRRRFRLLGAILLATLVCPAGARAQTQCWGYPDPNGNDYQFCFPAGAVSFADIVLRYSPNFTNCSGNACTGVSYDQTVSSNALGPPQWSWYSGSCGNAGQSVSLGNGGFLEVGFVDNWLSNSGDPGVDLVIYEIGKGRSISNACNQESFSISLRPASNETRLRLLQAGKTDPNGDGYFDYGGSFGIFSSGLTYTNIDGWVPGLPPHALKFDAVRITDIRDLDCGCGESPGADIDAVGAFTVPCTRFNQGGVDDGYVSPEDATRSTHLTAALTMLPLGYDQIPGVSGVPAEGQLAQTFSGLPTAIDAAMLMLDLKAGTGGLAPGSEQDDRIRIGFADAGGFAEHWSGRIGELTGEAGLARGAWISGRQEVMGLNLAELPLAGGGTLDLIPAIETRGFLDVIVENNTGGDHLRLSYSPCAGSNLDAPRTSVTKTLSLSVAPQPARGAAKFRFASARTALGKLSIFDAMGRLAASFTAGSSPAANEVMWDLRDRRGQRVPAGFYIARFEVAGETTSTGVVVIE